MSRPFTGKTHTGIRHITRPNGDVYVYERVTQYDPQAKKTQTLKTTFSEILFPVILPNIFGRKPSFGIFLF